MSFDQNSLKVYELARELGLDSFALLEKMKGLDVQVKSHMSSLGLEAATKIREAVRSERRASGAERENRATLVDGLKTAPIISKSMDAQSRSSRPGDVWYLGARRQPAAGPDRSGEQAGGTVHLWKSLAIAILTLTASVAWKILTSRSGEMSVGSSGMRVKYKS